MPLKPLDFSDKTIPADNITTPSSDSLTFEEGTGQRHYEPRGKFKGEETINILPKDKSTGPSSGVNVRDLPDAPGNLFYQHGTVPIKKMQQAIISLAKDLASTVSNTTDTQTNSGEYLAGTDPFLNFLVTAYMKKAGKVGKQFTTADQHVPGRVDTAKELDNFKGVLHTLQRIGTPNKQGGEQAPDGDWGPRTNNALLNIYALAKTLIDVQRDMGINFEGYTENDLRQLGENIPETHNIDLNDKIKRAQTITSNLERFRAVYDSFRDKVLHDPNISPFLSQQKPLMTVSTKIEDIAPLSNLTESEKELYKQQGNRELDTTVNGQPVKITPIDLTNVHNFKSYLMDKMGQSAKLTPAQRVAIEQGNQNILKKFLSEVITGLGA